MTLPAFPGAAEYIRHTGRITAQGMFYRFRKRFSLANVPATATLRMTGFTRYAVTLNGQALGFGPLASGRYCATYDTFSVGELLAEDNVLAVHLHVGNWGALVLEPAGWIGGGIWADLCDGDGQVLLVSDDSWRCEIDRAYGFNHPRRNDWRPLLEHVDARRDEPAWRELDFNDDDWPRCRQGNPWPTIHEWEKRPGRFEYETETACRVAQAGTVSWHIEPEEYYWTCRDDALTLVTSHEASLPCLLTPTPEHSPFVRFVFDTYVLGRPFFELEAPAGVVIDVIWGEQKADHAPWLTPYPRMVNWLRYTTREGRQRFRFFDLHGFKELQVIVRPGQAPVTLLAVGAERQWTMRCRTGTFAAEDDRYGQLWAAGARTVACITTDFHNDNSFREQSPWSGDQEWTKMGALVSEGIHPITTRQFRQFLKGQTRDGRLISPYPDTIPFERQRHGQKQQTTGIDLPDHALGYILSLGRYYRYSGDRDLIDAAWPSLERQIEYFRTVCGDNGLLDLSRLVDSWIWVDWKGLHDRSAPLNALWLGALRQLAAFAGDDSPYAAFYAHGKAAFQQTFWDPAQNVFIDRALHRPDLPATVSQLTQAMAACFELLPETCDRARLAATLTDLDGQLGIATPPMQGFVFSALEPLQAEDRLHALLHRQWLTPGMLAPGTIPEFWQGDELSTQAICQGGGPMISWVLTYYVLGVRPVSPGFETFTIQPVPGPLSWAAGTCPTPHGPLHVRWQRQADGEVAVTVKAPAGCQQVTA